jgi:hypothetical protein
MKIGIIGNGFVGKATKLLACLEVSVIVYDIRPEACEPLGTTIEDINNCDLVFFCLPTPMNHNGCCYTQILENSIKSISNPNKIVRSTVPIQFCKKHNCNFMPEFLTELNWREDFINSDYWIIGHDTNNLQFKGKIVDLFQLAEQYGVIKSSKVLFTSTDEAECIKLFKNTYLSNKVSIMNEYYDICVKKDINYNNVVKLMSLDKRIGDSHMNVPGYNGLRGFGGTCFPKDTHSIYSQFQEEGVTSKIFESVLYRNDMIDRPQREWVSDVWRTTLPRDKPISVIINGSCDNGFQLCKKLLLSGNCVICVDYLHNFDNLDINLKKDFDLLLTDSNFLIKKTNLTNKFFFPHIDQIHFLQKLNGKTSYNSLQTDLLEVMNTIELCRTHNSSFIYYNLYNEVDHLINQFSNEYNKYSYIKKSCIE